MKKLLQKKYLIFIIPAILLLVLLIAAVPGAVYREHHYRSALNALHEGDLSAAQELLSDIPLYRDSETILNREILYIEADRLMNAAESGDISMLETAGYSAEDLSEDTTVAMLLYRAAGEAFNALGDYKDSPSRAEECQAGVDREVRMLHDQAEEALRLQHQETYDRAFALLESGAYSEAHSAFESVDKKIEQAHIILTFPCFEYGDKRFSIVNLLTNVFCSEMSSRLFQSVREKLGLCYSIGGYPAAYKNNGYFVIYTSTNKKSVEKAVKAIRKEVDLLLENGITDAELSMGKEKLKTALVLGQESTYSIMKAFGSRLIVTGELLDIDKMIEDIDRITKDDVSAVAKEIFGSTNACATLVSDGVKADVLKIYQNS